MDEDQKSTLSSSIVLEVINGIYDGMRREFSALPITIGRSQDNGISIPFDTAASRAHAKIVRGETRKSFMVVDMNSTNGTYVNYQLIKDIAEIKPGDTLKIGDTQLKCFFDE